MGPNVGKITLPSPDFLNIGGIVANLITIAFFAAALFFLVQVAIGGISWINAGGDEKAMQGARGRITNAVIGLVIVAAAFAITIIVTTALGINIFSGAVISIP